MSSSPAFRQSPATLRPVGQIGGASYAVAATANRAYLGVGPASPCELGAYDGVGTVYGVTVSGQRAYLAAGFAGIVVLDLSDPSAPGVVARCDTAGYARDLTVCGPRPVVADGEGGLITLVNDLHAIYLPMATG